MAKLRQGDIILVNLDPSKGTETKKTRPCLVVSNNHYNQLLNTVLIAPISNSQKYKEKRFVVSPFFVSIPDNDNVKGTILLQHIRSIDPISRVIGNPIAHLNPDVIEKISEVIHNFF
ncbi:type II toxin-antitoxin system PemK/MazF family toxin [Alkalibacterium iburiense]|uniref:Type II toxin-antitoxin system PemK/MazF family toxin n=1 Tax=Alkalibacterium iburiense TaxID=290589 RepID=A0ABP3HDW5_9LACT